MNIKKDGISPNAGRLLWAGFMAILAAGVGAAIRGGILANWGREFGFTGQELGNITGAGFTGFCFGIIIGGVVCDKLGYGKLVIAAFAFHILSAFVTFAATGGMRGQPRTNSCIGARSFLPLPTVPSKPSPIRWWPPSSRVTEPIT
jgi:MFS family permease